MIRPATPGDAARVAAIWEEGWHEVHPGEVPDVLLAVRTSESFRERAVDRVADTLVAEAEGAVVGFSMTELDQVDQVYVAPAGRGTGAASALLAGAEHRIREAGYDAAWLAVVAGNARARAFYARQGWVDEGSFVHEAHGPDGPISVTGRRYVKRVADH